jgi:hypothetical protein
MHCRLRSQLLWVNIMSMSGPSTPWLLFLRLVPCIVMCSHLLIFTWGKLLRHPLLCVVVLPVLCPRLLVGLTGHRRTPYRLLRISLPPLTLVSRTSRTTLYVSLLFSHYD